MSSQSSQDDWPIYWNEFLLFLQPQIQLWRPDLATSIIEVDESGQVLNSKEMELYPAGLFLGVSGNSMQGSHISMYIPFLKGDLTKLLFTQNSLIGTTITATARRSVGESEDMHSQKQTVKLNAAKAETVGPVHHVRLQHQNDHQELQVSLQVSWSQIQGLAEISGSLWSHAHTLCAHQQRDCAKTRRNRAKERNLWVTLQSVSFHGLKFTYNTRS